jgi:hypothetical protein
VEFWTLFFISVGEILLRRKLKIFDQIYFFVTRRCDAGRQERTIQNATDSDGGASATELLTLVAPGSKGGFLNNNLRGIAQLAYIQQCVAAVSIVYRWRSLEHLHQHRPP